MSDPICAKCGKKESEHCQFLALVMPEGCVCNPAGWARGKIRPICAKFLPSEWGNCEQCEHDEACHKAS